MTGYYIAVVESLPTVENELAGLLICMLQIISEVTDIQARIGCFIKNQPCRAFMTIHNTDISYNLDEVDTVGKLRAPRVVLVLVCEIQ